MKRILGLCIILTCAWGNTQAFSCVAKPNYTTPGAPALPSLPQTFQARVEATIVDKNYTVTAEEYFDGPNNRAALTMLKQGLLYKLIYDYAHGQLFYVLPDNSCTTGNLSTDNNNMLFGNKIVSGVAHVYSTNGVLHFAKVFGETYIEQTVIRGIKVNHWQSCMYWAELKSNFTLDYYFSVPSWITAGGWSQVPVRAVAQGVQIQKDGSMLQFNHIYDYVDFRPTLYVDNTAFQTPPGVVCPGRYQADFSCVATNYTSPGAPALPSLPLTFQARVQATIIDKNFTVSAEEYFDGPNDRATLIMIQEGLLYKLIYDYAHDQLFYVLPDNSCTTGNLSTDNNNMLFGNKIVSGVPHVYTTNGVLHFAKIFGEKYIGQTVINGMLVNHWQTCMYWSELQSNFTLDYYFTVPSWITAGGWSQVPVRAEAQGVQIKKDGSMLQFHHIYDYVDFRPNLFVDDSMFQTPSGVVCPGRIQARAVPKLQGAYIYREEIIMSSTKTVAQADVWYDSTFYNMVRYDFRPQPDTAPYYNTDAATEIHDFNTGVAYAIDRTMANCTIIPIMNASFDTSINITNSINKPQFVLKMKSPNQLFYLDSSYSYEGQRMSPRGILCDVFISKRSDFMLQGQQLNATLQFYFLAQNWGERNNIGNINQKALDVPVRLEVSAPTIGFQAIYNIYNFAQENPEITVFDISPCFTDTDKISFKLVFYGNFDAPVQAYKQIFLLQLVAMVAEAAGVSPLRITSPSVDMHPDKAFFIANLVEKPPSIDKFRKIADNVLQFRNDATLTYVSSASDCADYCTTNTNFTCNSFDYCAQQQTCSLSKSHTEDGTLVPTPGQCDHYSRTLGSISKPEVPLQTAWQNLLNAVVKQLVTISITYDSGSKVSYTAADIQDGVAIGANRDPSASTTLKQFRAMVNRYVPNFDDLILTSMSVDDCAMNCVGQDTFICQSFEYEYSTGTCYLSHLHPDETPTKIQSINGVDLYIRDYTAKFTEVPGTTILSSSNVIYQNIYSANQCAKLCVDLNEFNCKSFDYCDDIGTCFLGKTHYFDTPKANIQADPMCNHWSRNYIGDFKFNKRKVVPMRDDRVVIGISVDQCAKLCVQEESFSCASFDYCGNYTECRLSSSTTRGDGQVTLEASAFCDVYTRQSFPDGTPYVANYQKYYGPPQPSSGFSSGAMGGLAIGMIIIGLLLAFGIIYAYMKLTNKSTDDMKIQFSKHMDSADS